MDDPNADVAVLDEFLQAPVDGDPVPSASLPAAASHLRLTDAAILIVDDQPTNIRLIEAVLRSDGYHNLRSTTDPGQVLDLVMAERPQLILLDLRLPRLSGFALLRRIHQQIGASEVLPILALTADASSDTRRRALAAGAMDYLVKPLDPVEVRLRVRNLLRTRLLHETVRRQNDELEERVRARTAELDAARLETLRSLAVAAEYRDDNTGQHTQRVARMACELARTLGLVETEIATLALAAPLHDVGKIAIPDRILLKPGPLTPDEFEVIKTHTTVGARILDGGSSATQRLARTIALSHHERWDGSGYPRGLVGAAIPLPCRIVAVADTFDVLTHERPYKTAWPVERAMAEIIRNRGTQFDPAVVDAFVGIITTDM